jgi:hypothetical protein
VVVQHQLLGDLLITDLGYFRLESFKKIALARAFFLSRFFIGTNLYDLQTNKKIDLLTLLESIQGISHQLSVLMGDPNGVHVHCRLLCLRVSEEIANERRRKIYRNAQRKGRIPPQLHLKLAGWTLIVTNIPQEVLPIQSTWSLYSLRWQIELIFKQMKSILHIERSNTGKESRLRCELSGKLLMAILIHKVHAIVNVHSWNTKRVEISIEKLYKRLQERLFCFANHLLKSIKGALAYFANELKDILKNCLKSKQKSRLTTLEILDSTLVNSIKPSTLT